MFFLNYRPEEFLYSSFLSRKTVSQHNFWFWKKPKLVAEMFKELIQQRRFTAKTRPPPLSLWSLWLRSPTEFKHMIFYKCSLLDSHEDVTCVFLPRRRLKILNVPINLRYHFSRRTHHNDQNWEFQLFSRPIP